MKLAIHSDYYICRHVNHSTGFIMYNNNFKCSQLADGGPVDLSTSQPLYLSTCIPVYLSTSIKICHLRDIFLHVHNLTSHRRGQSPQPPTLPCHFLFDLFFIPCFFIPWFFFHFLCYYHSFVSLFCFPHFSLIPKYINICFTYEHIFEFK